MRPKKDIQTKYVRILRKPAEGQKGKELAVVFYIIDGNATSPVLVNREVYFDRIDRVKKWGKNKGLSWEDVIYIRDHMGEVLSLLSLHWGSWGSHKKTAAGQDAAAGDDSISG